VPTRSMIQTINLNDKILVKRIHNFDNLKRGNVIVFYSDELKETLVKRLIGLPGDKIDIKNGVVFVNGEKLEEDYVKNKDDYNGSFEVPQGKYFFLGDNRPVSLDARYWKEHYIDSSKIEGKAQFIFYPFKDFGMLK
jgi:signal peptidase I